MGHCVSHVQCMVERCYGENSDAANYPAKFGVEQHVRNDSALRLPIKQFNHVQPR